VIAYFDTSAFLKLVVDEPGSEQAVELWIEADQVVSSTLLYPEGRAALAMATPLDGCRQPKPSPPAPELEVLFVDLALVSATIDLLRQAGDLSETHALRGHDAVHRASIDAVADPETVMVTADRHPRTAAQNRGLATATSRPDSDPAPAGSLVPQDGARSSDVAGSGPAEQGRNSRLRRDRQALLATCDRGFCSKMPTPLLMSGSFVHKIIIAGCRRFVSPLPSGPHQEDADADSKATRCSDPSSASLRPCGACDDRGPGNGDLRFDSSTHEVN
jgi:predicted nucleic acid-binding protein